MQLGSIEAGGTKFVCAVGSEQYEVIEQTQFPTTTPTETLERTVNFFKRFPNLDAISISSFGPIEIRKTAPKYGFITNTPKPNWPDTDFLGYIKAAFDVPVVWTTDVNGSAYGEYISLPVAKRPNSLVYFTIGTGVGAGELVNGHFLGELGHPEVGHVRLKRHPDDLDFAGICPYHGDCLEGLVAGPTFEARTGKKGQDVPLTDHVWDIMAYYIAQAAVQETLMLRPDKIVFGGGVMSPAFLTKIREQFKLLMNGYADVGELTDYMTMPVVPHNGSATVGNFALAKAQVKR
ncbi:branched chain amino acid 2-keto-4-methylthiobutyrate aminotransferase fructokinase [Secundilactobacillus odoratitofui DSM 19909 = JCM 15043]|uniref:fructokinase n=1 Tax=Secundilactobacillus odoratitofui DSM 19909 = JCM 15043 TaxID=1423776 RepID=A0A0R1LV61_9LACO|nr:fructokinase ScrK [Secundilactobacillus odoratitofui]KRK99676.1 branched chain amino acid 2-keto-4-methylthiobutyrate aminotransferase fructokinase [Secundilactobacillus odoratitofui DSM 19909 = JCM 15043]